jgi:pilus assembly protein CpaB
MRPKTLILFFVAIGCGLIASIGVSQYMEKARANSGIPLETLKVFVAAVEINIGEKLDDKNIKLEEWPKDRVPEGAVANLKELEGKYPRTRLYKGEPILAAKLSDSVDGNIPQRIPEGFRVVTVKVNAES